MARENCPGTTYQTITTEGTQSRSLYQASTAGATPGVVCQCNGTEMSLRQGASKTDSLKNDGHGTIVDARTFCCGRAQEVLKRMRS